MSVSRVFTRFRQHGLARELVRNSSLMTLAQVYQTTIAGLVQILMARRLGVEAIGLFTAGQALVGIVYSLTQLSVDVPAKREVSRNPDELQAYFGNALGLRLVVTVPATLAISIGAGLLSGISDPWTIVWLAGYTGLNGIVALMGTALQALNRFTTYALVSTVAQTVFYVGVAGTLIAAPQLHLALAAMVVGQVVLVAFYGAVMRSGHISFAPQWDFPIWRWLVVEARPLLLAAMAEFVSLRASVLFVNALIGTIAAGIYGVAYSFYMLVVLCAYIVSLGAFPTFARYSKERSKADYQRLVWKGAIVIATYGIVLAAILYWLGPHVLPVIYGPEFALANEPLRILSLALPFVALNRFMAQVLNASNRQWVTFRAIVAGAILNVSLNALLTPRFGIPAAAATIVATEALVWLVAWVGFTRTLPTFRLI